MRFLPRQITDKAFTVLTGASIVLLTLVLVVVLGPMLWRGGKAVFFTDTIEFRKMQRDRYSRGDLETLQQQAAQAQTFRSQAYAIIDEFRNGIDTEGLVARSKQVYRQFGKELRYRDLPREDYREIRWMFWPTARTSVLWTPPLRSFLCWPKSFWRLPRLLTWTSVKSTPTLWRKWSKSYACS